MSIPDCPYIIPGFKPIAKLGSGGFGDVFAMQEESQIQLTRAVKVQNPSAFFEGDPKDVDQRFLREADAISKLKHPSIVGYVTSGFTTDSHTPYIVMDYVEGEDLLEYVKRVPFEDRIRIFIAVMDAVGYAHASGVLHRDLKPSNILVRKADNQPVIVDFGLSYMFDGLTAKTITSRAVGTLGYIPPEVSANPSTRAVKHDIYSCGVLLYEAFAAGKPISEEYVPLSSVTPLLAGLDSIVRKAIAPVSTRYENAIAMKAELEAFLQRYLMLKNLPAPSSDFRSRLISKKSEEDRKRYLEERKQKLINSTAIEVRAMMYEIFKDCLNKIHLELINLFPYYEFACRDSILGVGPSDRPLSFVEITNTETRDTLRAGEFLLKGYNGLSMIEDLRRFFKHSGMERDKCLSCGYVIYSIRNLSSNEEPFPHAMFITSYELTDEDFTYQIYGMADSSDLVSLSTPDEIGSFINRVIEGYYS